MSAAALHEPEIVDTDRLSPGDEISSYTVVRALDGQMALASRSGEPARFILAPWPGTEADRSVLRAPRPASRHPHWLPVVDILEHADATVLVHRAVAGPRLDAFFRRIPLTPGQVDGVARSLIAAVESAHRSEHVVGTLCPTTIWVAAGAYRITPMLVGVGLAHLIPEATRRWVLENVESRFLAPEVLDGGPLTLQSDRYTLGALLFQLATGHPPPRSHGAPLPPLDELPARIRDTVWRCLAIDPAARPRDVLASWTGGRPLPTRIWPPHRLERIAHLGPYLAGSSITDLASARPREMPSAATSRRLPGLATVALLIVAIALSVWVTL